MEDYRNKVSNYMQLYSKNTSKFTSNTSRNTSKSTSKTNQIRFRGAMGGAYPLHRASRGCILAPRIGVLIPLSKRK